jgi:hypothetical protein
MNISTALSSIPASVGTYFVIFVLVAAGLVRYALRTKGDVRATFSHGRTVLELEAKERSQSRK